MSSEPSHYLLDYQLQSMQETCMLRAGRRIPLLVEPQVPSSPSIAARSPVWHTAARLTSRKRARYKPITNSESARRYGHRDALRLPVDHFPPTCLSVPY